jgi:ABC-2 type transport system ATP-binding protein
VPTVDGKDPSSQLEQTKSRIEAACDSDDLRQARRHLGVLLPFFEVSETLEANTLLYHLDQMEGELAKNVDDVTMTKLRQLLHQVKALSKRATRQQAPPPAEPLLRLQRVTRKFPGSGFELADVNFELRAGDLVAVVGTNGAGKSTFLRLAARMLRQDAGTISYPAISDAKGRPLLSRISFVPHNPPAWPATLGEHMELSLAFHGVVGRKNAESARALLDEFDLWKLRDQTWIKLSAGWRSRCALALALAASPAILILDEPMASLDPAARRWFLEHLYRLSKRGRAHRRSPADQVASPIGIVASTHVVPEVESIATRVIHIHDGRAEELARIDDTTGRVFEIALDQKWRAIDILVRDLALAEDEFRVEERPDSRVARVFLPARVSRAHVLSVLIRQGCTPVRFADLSSSAARWL